MMMMPTVIEPVTCGRGGSDVPESTLDHALDLWRRGLSVIPVPRPRPGVPDGQPGDGKVPTVAWRPYQTQCPTEDELRTWFATEQNIAVVTGELSGVVVIDASRL